MGLIFSLGLLPNSMNPFAGVADMGKNISYSSSASSSCLLCLLCIFCIIQMMSTKHIKGRIKKLGGSEFDTSSYDFSSSEF